MAHRDLAARNILLCDNNVVKIADFGLCCTFNENFSYQATNRSKRLPIKWLSLEALIDWKFSEKSDVWSFGVLIYEMFSLGKVPYNLMSNNEITEFLESGQRLERPENATEEIYGIMSACWEKDVEKRPNFVNLIETLQILLEKCSEEYTSLKEG